MLKQTLKYTCLLFILSLTFGACVKDVDFDQINDFEISPIIESSLIFFDEPANRFYEDGNEITRIQDAVVLNFFNQKFVVDNLIKADFVFEIANSINRGFQVRVDFLNNADQLQHSFTFMVAASPTNNDIFVEYIEVFEGNSLAALKASSKLVLTLDLIGGVPIDANSPGHIGLRSKGAFYLNIDSPL